jgi:hypothetical protein
MKHFNAGNIWGRVAEVERKYSAGGTPYLSIQVECPNSLYGNVKTYGRLWGEDKGNAFFDYHKDHPGAAYRFRGFFSQYDKEEGKRYSNFTLYSWEAFEGGEFRAAFILTGEVTAVENKDGEGKLYLHLKREGQGDYRDVSEDFEVYFPNAQDVAGISEGDTVQVKGLLRYKEPDDYFGGSPSGPVKPYVKELKVYTAKDAPAEITEQEAF